ncbi:MAG: pilus assembly protein [Eubacteriales bacterium]|nr:pilus assembly protein [Eubacteriales bacterium]
MACSETETGTDRQNQKMKERKFDFPAGRNRILSHGKSRRGSLTVEAACVVPLFLFIMIAVLQFARISTATSAILAGMQDAAKEMAAYAYIRELGISPGEGTGGDMISGGLSAAYASSRIARQEGYVKDEVEFSLLQTSFHDEIIDLAGSCRLRHSLDLLPALKVRSILRARVRAWTGRAGSGGKTGGGDAEEDDGSKMVYMAETGKVYHTDPDCTHIKLKIQAVSRDSLSGRRNTSGGKYHACERCRTRGASTVYISPYGDKYHGSLDCSGLKRTIRKVRKDEVGSCRPCSKCSGG